MSMSTPTVITFIVYLVGMLVIGFVAYKMTSNLWQSELPAKFLRPV